MLSVYCNYQTAAFTAGPDYMSADLPLANQSDSVQCHYISIIHHMQCTSNSLLQSSVSL